MDDFFDELIVGILEAIASDEGGLLDKLAKKMRSATPEEERAIQKNIEKISKPTGVNFWEELKQGDKGMKKIKIKYFTDKIEKLRYIDGKSDWIDLRAAERVELKAGEFKLIPLGIAMELPKGYEAHIVPRGSTFKNYGIIQTNHCGIVDETYCGDNDQWFMPAYALRDTVIEVNDRICQFRIFEHQPTIRFEEVEMMNNEDRGGHGSTGKQ